MHLFYSVVKHYDSIYLQIVQLKKKPASCSLAVSISFAKSCFHNQDIGDPISSLMFSIQ